jgi:hypothetical protein
MIREVTEAIEFLQWLLEGLIKFYPDHPLFSHIDVERVTKGEDKWVGEDARGLVDLARRSLGVSSTTPLNEVISRLQSLVENPSTVSSLPEPVLARLREEEEELLSGDSPQEKKAKLENISRRPIRPRYEPRVPAPTGPSPKVPTPPTAKAEVETAGFIPIKAPADVSTLQGATKDAFVDQIVETVVRDHPELSKAGSLEELRGVAEDVAQRIRSEGTGGQNYRINLTAFSRAITDRARLPEVLMVAPEPKTPSLIYMVSEGPTPTPTPETRDAAAAMVNEVRRDKEAWAKNLEASILNKRPDMSQADAEAVSKRIADRIAGYEPTKAADEAVFASVALNPELFERIYPKEEIRTKILDETIKSVSQRQKDKAVAEQVLPTVVSGIKEGVVEVIYAPAEQRFREAPQGATGAVSFEPETFAERIEKAPQTGIDLSGVISPAVPSAPVSPQNTLEFLSLSQSIPEDNYKKDLALYIEAQVNSHPQEELEGLSPTQIRENATKAAELIIEKTPDEVKASPSPVPVIVDVPKLIESFRAPAETQGDAIVSTFEVAPTAPAKENQIQVVFSPGIGPAGEGRSLLQKLQNKLKHFQQKPELTHKAKES